MNFIEWCEEKQITKKEVQTYLKRAKYTHTKEETFMNNYDKALNNLKQYGFTTKEAKTILIITPSNVCSAYKNKENVDFIINNMIEKDKKNLYLISIYLKYDIIMLQTKIDFLINIGFSKEDIKKALSRNNYLLTYSLNNLKEHVKYLEKFKINKKDIVFFISQNSKRFMKMNEKNINEELLKICKLGFTYDEVLKMVKKTTKLITIDKSEIKDALEIFISCGLNKEKAIEKFNKNPFLFDSNLSIYKQIIKYLKNNGFDDKDIKKITIKAPELISQKSNKINNFYKLFIDLGFTKKEIKEIILGNSKVLYHKSAKIIDTYYILKLYNLTNEQIKHIFVNYPRIIESSSKSLEEKLKLLKQLDILNLTIIKPKDLIQGCEKTFLRYCYIFNELEQEITLDNYKLLYKSASKQIPDIKLLRTLYSYEHYINNTLDKRLKYMYENNIKVKCL